MRSDVFECQFDQGAATLAIKSERCEPSMQTGERVGHSVGTKQARSMRLSHDVTKACRNGCVIPKCNPIRFGFRSSVARNADPNEPRSSLEHRQRLNTKLAQSTRPRSLNNNVGLPDQREKFAALTVEIQDLCLFTGIEKVEKCRRSLPRSIRTLATFKLDHASARAQK
jgi:hypothetical protein